MNLRKTIENMYNCDLVKFDTYKEDNKLYANLTYLVTNEKESKEYHFPKVDLGIYASIFPNIEVWNTENGTNKGMISYLYGEKCFDLEIGVENYMYRVKTLKREMTLSEIEKELGYKIILKED